MMEFESNSRQNLLTFCMSVVYLYR
uniref:Uncharacterized protein n=1 Tax=Anguilla anguilla TaxID=7936 RepID=A0A0E9XRY1_ANGAN